MKRVLVAAAAAFIMAAILAMSAASSNETDWLSQSWTNMQSASLYATWKKQNKGEASKLEAYWASGGTPPVVSTAFGKALVLEAQAYWSLGAPPPPPPPPPPPSDIVAPSVPDNQREAAADQTSITMAWDASTDNVGVAGYDVYLNGNKAGSTTATQFTFAGLACGTSYTVGVAAFDAAGNRSDLMQATGIMATAQCDTPPPPPPSGNATVFLSPIGNDGAACTQTAPCRTLERGYSVAANGATVQLADGFYPCATLAGTKAVVFRGDGAGTTAGNVPWITCVSGRPTSDSSWPVSLKVTASSANLSFDGVWIAGLGLDRGSSNITLTNTHITCENDGARFALLNGFCTAMIVEGANNFTMTGGEIGPTYEGQGFGSGSWHYGSNATYDGVHFHDNLPNSGHSELLLVWSGNGLTIKNSTFTGWGGTAAIYFSEFGTVGASNVLFENNYIAKTSSAQIYALYIGTLTNAGGTRNFKIRYNTIYNGIYSDNAGQDGSQIVGNVSGYSSECPSGFFIDHNVWGDDDNRSCGSNSVTVPSASYTCSGCGFDTTGHLTSSSPAIGRGNPNDHPVADIDGQTRPIGAVDAGSDER